MEVIWDILGWIGVGWFLLQAYSLTVAWLRSRRKRPGARHGLRHCKRCWEMGWEEGWMVAAGENAIAKTPQPSSPPSSPATESTEATHLGNNGS